MNAQEFTEYSKLEFSGLLQYGIVYQDETKRLKFYLSGNCFDQDGIAISSGLKRYGARVNVESELAKSLRFEYA